MNNKKRKNISRFYYGNYEINYAEEIFMECWSLVLKWIYYLLLELGFSTKIRIFI